VTWFSLTNDVSYEVPFWAARKSGTAIRSSDPKMPVGFASLLSAANTSVVDFQASPTLQWKRLDSTPCLNPLRRGDVPAWAGFVALGLTCMAPKDVVMLLAASQPSGPGSCRGSIC
jgi:hypothetical protein